MIHICGGRAIFLLFCDNQDTDSDDSEMEIGVAEQKVIHKNIKGSMGKQYTNPKRMEQNI